MWPRKMEEEEEEEEEKGETKGSRELVSKNLRSFLSCAGGRGRGGDRAREVFFSRKRRNYYTRKYTRPAR